MIESAAEDTAIFQSAEEDAVMVELAEVGTGWYWDRWVSEEGCSKS
jgi:hypothetical protein